MKNRIIALVVGIVLLLFSSLLAQAPDTLWTREYGWDYWDECREVQQTPDGGFIFAGRTTTSTNGFTLLMKTDNFGNTLWTKTYKGMGGSQAWSMDQTTDKGYVITGRTADSTSTDYYVPIIKTDSLGDTLWTKIYGGVDDDFGWSIQQTPDGGYIVAGETASFGAGEEDVYLIRTDSMGDTLWTKTYGGSLGDFGYSVKNTSDSGFVIAGCTGSFGAQVYDMYIIKTDAQGETLWTKMYGGQYGDIVRSIWQTPDGGYILTGESYSYGVQYRDIFLLKLDSLGDSLWLRIYGGDDTDIAYSLCPTSDGGFVIGGYTNSFGAWSIDFYIIRTDSQGDTLWTKIIGRHANWIDMGFSIFQTNDGGYIMGGRVERSGWNLWDAYLVRLEPDPPPGVEEGVDSPGIPRQDIVISPNPFSASTNIRLQGKSRATLTIYNSAGRRVREISLLPFNFLLGVTWDGKDDAGKMLPPGIYFFKLNDKPVGKVVKVR